MPFACIYVPNFSVAAALRAEPELKAHAVAILEGKPPLEKIIAINEKARRTGHCSGHDQSPSRTLLRPRLALTFSRLQESAAHAALLDCAQSFSPCVEDSARDTVLLDLAGMESLFGSLPEISRAISTRAAALGLDTNVADRLQSRHAPCSPPAGFPGNTRQDPCRQRSRAARLVTGRSFI